MNGWHLTEEWNARREAPSHTVATPALCGGLCPTIDSELCLARPLPPPFVQGAVQNAAGANAVLTAELQLKQAVGSGAALLALPGNTTSYQALATKLFQSVAAQAGSVARAPASGAAGSRRLAQATPAFSLASAAMLTQVCETVTCTRSCCTPLPLHVPTRHRSHCAHRPHSTHHWPPITNYPPPPPPPPRRLCRSC